MTAIRTMFEAGYYAVTTSSTRYLILDRFQQINIANIDDFSLLFKHLRIEQRKYFPVESLINACIVFALAKEIGLQPGLFAEGDAAIVAHCRSRISSDVMVEDHDLLMQELIQGWQTIATSELAKKYVKLGEFLCAEEDKSACLFLPVGGFSLFVQDYFTGCMRAFIKDGVSELPLMMQFCSLVHANVLGVGFHHNRFFHTELFLAQGALILPEMGEYRERLATFIAQEKARYEAFRVCCFTEVVGWAKIELCEIEEFEDAAAAVAIAELLQGKSFTNSEPDLIAQLKDLRQQLAMTSEDKNLLLRSCHFSGTKWKLEEQHALVREAIHYAVIDYAKQYVFKPHGKRPLQELPLYCLAGQGVVAEERLLTQLLEGVQVETLKPFEWYAILQNAKNEALIEFTQQTIMRFSTLEERVAMRGGLYYLLSLSARAAMPPIPRVSQAPLAMPITYQYRRLQQVVRGSPLPRSSAASSSSQTEADDLANSLQETLNLQERNSGCVLM